jgi:hypothetical protein
VNESFASRVVAAIMRVFSDGHNKRTGKDSVSHIKKKDSARAGLLAVGA